MTLIKKVNFLIILSIFLSTLLVGAAYWFTYNIYDAGAAGGAPAHGRYDWTHFCCGPGNGCNTSYCSSSDITHIQEDLNYLHHNLGSFYISGGPLAIDGTRYEGDAYNQATENAVIEFQQWHIDELGVGSSPTGNFFNQTSTFAHYALAIAESEPVRHPAGAAIRYPIWSECRLITNNNSRPFVVPFRSSGEWSRFKSYAPNKSNVSDDCGATPPAGGGGSGGGSSSSTTYGTLISCKCSGGTTKSQCHTADSATICNSLCFPEGYTILGRSCSSSCNNSGC